MRPRLRRPKCPIAGGSNPLRFVVLGIAGVIPDLGEGRLRKAQEPPAQLIVGERLPLLGDNHLELSLGRQLHWLLQHDLLPSKCAATVFMPLTLPLSPHALRHSLLTFVGLKRRPAVYQGLGKGRLPAFPRLPPLSACRAEPLLEAPIAKRVKAAHPKVSFVSDTCSVTGSRGLTCGSGGLYRHGNDSKTSFI